MFLTVEDNRLAKHCSHFQQVACSLTGQDFISWHTDALSAHQGYAGTKGDIIDRLEVIT